MIQNISTTQHPALFQALVTIEPASSLQLIITRHTVHKDTIDTESRPTRSTPSDNQLRETERWRKHHPLDCHVIASPPSPRQQRDVTVCVCVCVFFVFFMRWDFTKRDESGCERDKEPGDEMKSLIMDRIHPRPVG